METILKPCRVPWAISPSTGGITLTHVEPDARPRCTVVFGGGRLNDDRIDDRRIEIEFELGYFARCGPHDDTSNIESIGYRIAPKFDGAIENYSDWRRPEWKATGYCPKSGFYVATQSAWLATVPEFYQRDFRHYVVDGRDGYVEVIARSFKWREWLWGENCHREEAPSKGPVVGSGEGKE